MPIFSLMVHVLIFSSIDNCNFLFIDLPKPCLVPLQSVLVRLLIWLPRFFGSLISLLLWQNNSIFLHGFSLRFSSLAYKAFLGLAPHYLWRLIMHPLSAISNRLLCSLDRNDLLDPQSRTFTSQCQRALLPRSSIVESPPCTNPRWNSIWLVFFYRSSSYVLSFSWGLPH